MNKILLVGQTPPPYHGQAIIIHKILNGQYDNVRLYHVRMGFSKEMNELGKVKLFKVFHLFSIILKIVYFRIFHRVKVLYYPPSGPDKIPVYRDIIILFATRWMFKKTIFHFHASGISEIWNSLNGIEKLFFKKSFFYCDTAISMADRVSFDAQFLKAKKNVIIPYGIEDCSSDSVIHQTHLNPPKILFVGLLRETKGEFVLIEACRILLKKKIDFSVDIAGSFGSEQIKERFFTLLKEYHLLDRISYKGLIKGEEKNKIFSDADIFCFPSYYESEAFPIVLIEAMQFSLPVISTLWRGIPDMINEGENGYLVNIKDPEMLAERMEKLIIDEPLRKQMGDRGRAIYLEKYTIEKFYRNLESVFLIK